MLSVKVRKQTLIALLLFALLVGGCSDGQNPAPAAPASETGSATATSKPEAIVVPAGSPAGAIVLRNGLVFTATDDEPVTDGALVIEEGVITAVGPEAEIVFPEAATIVDVRGGTVLPGIVDARASDLLNRLAIEDGQIRGLDLLVHLEPALKAGLTTIRATGWDWRTQPDVAEMRAALEAHSSIIPRVVLVGPMLTHAEGTTFQIYPDQNIGVVTAEEAKQATEDLIGLGLDQIGYVMALPRPASMPESDTEQPSLTLEQQEAIVAAAHAQGKRVIGQAVFQEEAALAVAAGVDEIPSWPSLSEPLGDELIKTLVDNSVSILTGYSVGFGPNEGDARRFIDAGGTIVFGTFAPNSRPLAGFYDEMNLMSVVGKMTPMEIIVSATRNAAEAVGLGDQIGTLEVGKTADILVVNGNPLEDLTAIRDGVSLVIKSGEFVSLDS